MVKIGKELIQELRDRTGLGMMDCRKALEETEGNIEKAIEILRKKGALVAAKRASKQTSEGVVYAYIHPGDRLGVMIEINCETDFVAKTDAVRMLAKDLCMHIAAIKPLYVNPEEVDGAFLEREKNILKEQLVNSGKPTAMIDQIVEGKISKLYSEICLLKQQFVKNDQQTVQDAVNQVIAKTGENVVIKRFARFELGL
ncbi:translation elongation factor Ts [bacterium]|nr:MAG: translation elongation factor Ts [bacterium]QQR61717.1 MAG: translation elongation factor Ts [bacterium]QQR62715.1 MAG: translation elongation factor Ts [bacterium]